MSMFSSLWRRLSGLRKPADGGSGDHAPAEPLPAIPLPATTSSDPKTFVLGRELSEVHLLLENLSANPNTNLVTLIENAPCKGLDENWIEQICQISWPPSDSAVDRAKQAALLIRVKDYLNSLSRPASGSSIAFTLLVTQEEEGAAGRRKRTSSSKDVAAAPSRNSLACDAYPDLAAKARTFRRWMWWVSVFLLVWLVLTCLISWYVALGNAALGDLATARTSLQAAEKRVDDAEKDGARDSKAPTQPASIAAPGQPAPYLVSYCDRPAMIPPTVSWDRKRLVTRFEDAEQRQACEAQARAREGMLRAQGSLAVWLAPWRDSDAKTAPRRANYAASLVTIMGSAILPVLYGFLGAAAAIVRSLSRKIRGSLLTPRDLQLSVQQLALGAVVGACIGLFIAQPGASTAGEGHLLGPVTLSGSALSFIAGFGVDAVFQALEGLIQRIFNLSTAPSPASTDPSAT